MSLPLVLLGQNEITDDDTVFTLSPFVVDASGDEGYYAANTLSGTRLNSSLLTTPSAVSEFTMDFLEDIGANSLRDALAYSMAFEVEDGSDNGNHLQFGNGLIKARGFGGSEGSSTDFFFSDLNPDRYNIERLSFSRGPNSILFGIGNPGGIINSVSKRAQFRSALTNTEFQVDNNGSLRGSADINRELFKDKLAIRFNVLSENKKFARKNQYLKSQRATIALTYKPFKSTSIMGTFERGVVERNQQRNWIARDGVTTWETAGSQTFSFADYLNADGTFNFNAAGAAVNLGKGQYLNADRATILYTPDGLVGTNFRFSINSTGTNAQFSTFDVWDRDTGLGGTVNTTDFDFWTTMVIAEQKIGKNLYIEAAFRREHENRTALSNLAHTELTPRRDIGMLLPDGSPNPNFLQYFLEGRPMANPFEKVKDTGRVTVSYSLDTGKDWLGRHQFAGMLQRDRRWQNFERYQLANTTPWGANKTVNANRLYTRTYLESEGKPGTNGGAVDLWNNPMEPFVMTNPATGAVVGTVTPRYVRDRGRLGEEIVDSMMIAGQSFFWKDRISVTYGYRKDEVEQKNFVETLADATYVAANPGSLIGEVLDGKLAEAVPFSGETKTVGTAISPFKWMTLTANFSENFNPQTRFNIYNENIGNVLAEGADYSIRLSLLDNKLYAVVNYYETTVSNENNNAFFWFTNMNTIWETLETAGVVTNPTEIFENSVTSESSTGKGFEFELVASPTRNITLRANYTTRENEVTDIIPHVQRYLDEHLPLWQQNADLLTASGQTVGTIIQNLENRRANELRTIGVGPNNFIKERASFFGRYSFLDGRLKGADIALGMRWTGERRIGYTFDELGNATGEVMGDDYFVWDLKLGYKKRIFGDVNMSLSLNVQNLFNFDKAIVTNIGPDRGGLPLVNTYNLLPPRTIALTAAFKF